MASAGVARGARFEPHRPIVVILPYSALPSGDDWVLRPIVDVVVGPLDEVLVPCLVDSGSVHTLVGAWIADLAGIDVGTEPTSTLRLGGGMTRARFATVSLAAAGHRWDATVGFCDPWPYPWGLAGEQSFFRHFTVTFRAVDHELELLAVDA